MGCFTSLRRLHEGKGDKLAPVTVKPLLELGGGADRAPSSRYYTAICWEVGVIGKSRTAILYCKQCPLALCGVQPADDDSDALGSNPASPPLWSRCAD